MTHTFDGQVHTGQRRSKKIISFREVESHAYRQPRSESQQSLS